MSAASSDSVALTATRPAGYGTHTTMLVISGTTASGGTIGPVAVEVRISYVDDLYEQHFPLITKNFAP